MSDNKKSESDTQNATTVMADETVPIIAAASLSVPLPRGIISSAKIGVTDTIETFMAKPTIIKRGVITTLTTGTFETISGIRDVLAAQPMYVEKIKGYMGFKATTVFTLQVNANSFQQGGLILHFQPMQHLNGCVPDYRNIVLNSITQQPHTRLDFATQTSTVFKIPYNTGCTHFEILTDQGDVGLIYLTMFGNLKISNNIDGVEYTIWAHFEDVELVTPTITRAFLDAQGPNIAEKERGQGGAFSKGMKLASTTLGAVAKVPGISAIAGTASWVTGVLGDAAAAFGWSAPTNLETPTRVVDMIHPFTNNCDMQDFSSPLSLKADNIVDVLPGFAGNDIDEMSFAYMLQRPTYFTNCNWSTTDPTDTVICSHVLQPNIGTVQLPTIGANTHMSSPLGALAKNFQYYRGSLTMRFTFRKTMFHSGRVAITYVPIVNYSGTAPVDPEASYLLREIIDIREGYEYTFTFPYANIRPYLPIGASYGNIYVTVLNELVCPDTVTPNIDILVEVWAAPDMELAAPIDNYAEPARNVGTWAPITGYVAHGGFNDTGDDLESANQTGFSTATIIDDESTSAQFCMGEKIQSVLQLLKRVNWSRMSYGPTAGTTSYGLLFDPFYCQVVNGTGQTSSANLVAEVALQTDLYSLIVPWFAYSRGSVRWKFINSSNTGQPRVTQFALIPKVAYAPSRYMTNVGSGLASYDTKGAVVLMGTENKQTWEVSVPQYNRLPIRVPRCVSNEAVVAPNYNDLYSSAMQLEIYHNVGATGSSVMMGRRVGDDFQLGGFISVMPYKYFF